MSKKLQGTKTGRVSSRTKVESALPKRAKATPPPPIKPQANARYMTGALGQELEKANTAASAALIALGYKPKKVPPLRILTDYPFTHTLGLTNEERSLNDRLLSVGRTLGGQGKDDIVWPDMKKVQAEARAKKAPMTQGTKEKLRATAAAKPPKDRGDPVAVVLRAANDLDGVYAIAARYLKVKPGELKKKYGHLNTGQQRMNCGNRMRGLWRKTGVTP